MFSLFRFFGSPVIYVSLVRFRPPAQNFFTTTKKKNARGVRFLLELITGFEPVTSSFRHKPPCIVSLCREGKGIPFTSGLFLFPKKRKLKLISFFREPCCLCVLGKASTTGSKNRLQQQKKERTRRSFLLELITGFEPVTSSFRHKPPCIVSLCREGKGIPFTSGLFLFPKKRKLKLFLFFREPCHLGILGKASTTGSKFLYNNKKTNAQGVRFSLELITGFEPVTSSLPRMRSTC